MCVSRSFVCVSHCYLVWCFSFLFGPYKSNFQHRRTRLHDWLCFVQCAYIILLFVFSVPKYSSEWINSYLLHFSIIIQSFYEHICWCWSLWNDAFERRLKLSYFVSVCASAHVLSYDLWLAYMNHCYGFFWFLLSCRHRPNDQTTERPTQHKENVIKWKWMMNAGFFYLLSIWKTLHTRLTCIHRHFIVYISSLDAIFVVPGLLDSRIALYFYLFTAISLSFLLVRLHACLLACSVPVPAKSVEFICWICFRWTQHSNDSTMCKEILYD